MKPQTGFEIEGSGQIWEPEPESGSNEPVRPEPDGPDGADHSYAPRVRPSEANGFAVYTRNRRFKSRMAFLDKLQGASSNGEVLVRGGGESENVGGAEGNLGNSQFGVVENDGELMEIEVKGEEMVVRSEGSRRFTRSVFRSNDEEMDNGDLRDTVILEVDGLMRENSTVFSSMKVRKMEMNMPKKTPLKWRPETVRELFETGLLEGYPVFYNGGKRGFALRGVIKDAGILCSCSFCKGARVVPPCQFEIHACKSYRRASQYICLENGKSLLDVVKECRKSSVKTLEETIQNFIGPMPVKESFVCTKCNGSFLATSAVKTEALCDSCMIILNSDFDEECVKSRPLEPFLGLPISNNGEVHSTSRKRGRPGRKKRKHSELISNVKPPGKSSLKGRKKKKGQSKTIKILSNTTTLSKSLESESPSISLQSKSSAKITKKDQTMHKLIFEKDGLRDGTEVAYYSNGKKLRDGYKDGPGIMCTCCNTVVSASQFEAHAGWASRRKPYMYIYTSDGVSLHEVAISLLKGRKYFSKKNNELCIICADGGKLVLCDGCPRSFHKECASLSHIRSGNKWYCTYCQNMFEKERSVEQNANAVAAGRVLGIDSIEQITNRCIRIVKNPEEVEVIACVLCRGYDFSKSGFGPRTVILCDQCEKEYHVGCLKKSKMSDLKELPKGKWFCSANCKWIYSTLQNLLSNGAEQLPDSSLDIIKKKQIEKSPIADTHFDVRWRLLNGKITSRETRVLLSQAVSIFHDSFDPIVDSETGRDFIPSMVYGRNIRGQDFSGMYCAILTVNSTVVSAGILRIFGQEIAELPLAATRNYNQGKGYFQTLYSCIEKLLAYLNVKSIVLPATDDAKSIWTEKFEFGKIPEKQLLDYRKTCWQMITFKGTSMLEKPVPKCRIINQDEADTDVSLH